MHRDRDVGIGLDGGLDEVLEEELARIGASAGGGLEDHGGADFFGRRHNGLDLLEVVDVEGGNAVGVFSCVVEQLAHGYESHGRRLRKEVLKGASILTNGSARAA